MPSNKPKRVLVGTVNKSKHVLVARLQIKMCLDNLTNSRVFRERLGGVMSNKYKKRLARRRQEKLRGFAELVISSYYFNIVSWRVSLVCVACRYNAIWLYRVFVAISVALLRVVCCYSVI